MEKGDKIYYRDIELKDNKLMKSLDKENIPNLN
jgi:hypothetical protein